MRILGISGSPRGRNSSTLQLVERVLEGAKAAGAETELIDVSQTRIDYCVGCNACHITGTCPRKDDMASIRDKMLTSDGLVLGSPLYFDSVTAQLKTLIDRLSGVVHCQMFLGKYACSVSTGGGPEWDMATTYMNNLLVRLGCAAVGSAGAAMGIPGAFETSEQEAVALGRDLMAAIQERREYPEQNTVHAAMHERFKYLITANKDNWPYEYGYWVEHRGL